MNKIAFIGFLYEPGSLDLNEVCFDKERDVPNMYEKSRKIIVLLHGVDVGNVQ